jgi:hypothetical protein
VYFAQFFRPILTYPDAANIPTLRLLRPTASMGNRTPK